MTTTTRAGTLFPLAQLAFLVFVALLALMKFPVTIGGLDAFGVDFAFVLCIAFWGAALFRGETTLRLHWGFILLILYFLAMALSWFQSAEPQRSAFKLLTQVYLLLLPVLAFNLVRSMDELRRVFRWWVWPAGVVGLLGLAALLLFPVLGPASIVGYALHNFGTLPPGPYPRLEMTFVFPSILANYLGSALVLLLVGGRLGWFSTRTVMVLGPAMGVTALFALTPGFGGVLFNLGAWFWYARRKSSPRLAWIALVGGCAAPIVGALLASVATIIDPSAPFLIHPPGLAPLAPSVRLVAWIEASQNFLDAPLLGRGIGVDTVDVVYETLGCSEGCLTEAHHTFLNIAVQCGAIGLMALWAVIWLGARPLGRLPRAPDVAAILFGLSIAWVSGMALQGLVGSFEDNRSLWVVLGLILSASRLDPAGQIPRRAANPDRVSGQSLA